VSSPVDIAVLGIGVVLIVLAAVWRFADRRRPEASLDAQLAHPDAGVRRAAVEAAARDGVGRHAAELVTLAEQEQDDSVRVSLAEAVARHQWEPARDPRVRELRRWARRQLEADGTAGAHDEATVLVTGVGGAAGVAVLRALSARGVRVVGADADWLAAGLPLADDAGVLPRCSEPDFVDELCLLAVRTGATVLVSTIAEEMPVLARCRRSLEEAGLAVWLPQPRAVETCIDKWRFAEAVEAAGVPAPATALGAADGVPGPWIVKPRFGRGSRDVYTAETSDELDWALARVPQPIVQTRLGGLEFTVDALVGRDGRLVGAVPRWRLETKAGISSKGRTFVDPELLDGVEALLAAVGLDGPANVQGFLGDDDGAFAFVEVNPRFSGGLPLSLAAGADLVGEYLRGIRGGQVEPDRLSYSAGTTVTRHLAEVYV
jgi:carbamoyl-phosphate synthase large subunit